MESIVRKITSFLKNRSSNTAHILTIWGMAGIGKTCLADYIFKLHYHDFERSCFLDDIERRCRAPDGLLDLQKKLLKDIQDGSWMDTNDTDVGTFKIEKSLLRKKTLLVLDSVDNFEQLDVLLGTKGLHPESKIIITSKNGSLTEKCRLFQTQVPPKHSKHLLKGLNEDESLQLLSWHAFGRNEPREDDKKGSIKVVAYCKGHPLALKVLGSSLRHEDATLEGILESLGKEINPNIQKVLQISFDTLPYKKDKELFKHIACFFVGEDRKFTEEILKACGVCTSSGIRILINRCLLTVVSSNNLEMHQLLQDMGRDLVRQESPKEPWNRSLLWHHEESLDVLQNSKGTETIQGLALDMKRFDIETSHVSSMPVNGSLDLDHFRYSAGVIWRLCGWVSGLCSSLYPKNGDFEAHTFSKMCNLRLLQLNYVELNGSYNIIPNGLRWLCMHGFPLSYIPSDLQMDHLVALDMSHSNLKQLWKEPKLLRSLKFLNLGSCHELVSVGHFSWFPALESLILERCTSLDEVCESIGTCCGSLEVLNLSECIKLRKLPNSLGKLKNLTKLSIAGCSNLSAINVKDMASLKVLMADNVNIRNHASSSAIVKAIPKGLKTSETKRMEPLQVLEDNNYNIEPQVSSSAIENAMPRSFKTFEISLPISLVKLSLRNNNLSNESFPKDFSSLLMLKSLYLDNNPIDSLPDCVRSLSRLETLTLRKCGSLKTILGAQNTIKYLNIQDCSSLEKVTFYPEKSAPPEVDYYSVSTMSELQGKFKLEALSEVDEEILHSLGWKHLEYSRYYCVMMSDCEGCYLRGDDVIPTQLLYEHGIFSTYLKGQEVPKWFTHISNGSSFTLQSTRKNCRISGINLCIVSTISNSAEIGPSRIEIRNLTKKSSWTYEPAIYPEPEDLEFRYGDDIVVWLSHWMFGNNEFEDGDKVSVRLSKKFKYIYKERYIGFGGHGPDYANVKEYGISLVYDDGTKKEDPLAYYKSWNHIIGRDLSPFEVSTGHYLLKQWLDNTSELKWDAKYEDNTDNYM
ncbi:TMV resistance protein N-like protein [Tanacetum coccineum]